MEQEKNYLRDEIVTYKLDFGLLQKIPCTKEENKKYEDLLNNGKPLPDGVFSYIENNGKESNDTFYTIYETELTKEEINEYLALKKLKLLNTIKNCSVFFVVLTIISIITTALLLFGNMRITF